MIQFKDELSYDKDAVVLFVTAEMVENETLTIDGFIKNAYFNGENSEIFPVITNNNLFLLVGLGKESELTETTLRTITRTALRSSFLKKMSSLEIVPHNHEKATIVALIEGIKLGTYYWDKYKTEEKKSKVDFESIDIITQESSDFEKYIAICDGVNQARDLINDNADVVTSELFEEKIKELTNGNSKCELEILNEKELKEHGLGLHLAVNQGSQKEPKLIIVKYTGNSSSDKFTACIGKGMTFDTGGLNLKPTNGIEDMKLDMGGAAAIFGTLYNTVKLDLDINALFVFGMAENAIGSAAYKPGDVLTSYSGKTVEVGNTDAEGRLVLADAISYTIKNYQPEAVVDVATLTGAVIVALAHDHTGLVTDDDQLAEELLKASQTTDDWAWRLPMYPELKNTVKSKIADIRNLGNPRGAGGTITAAEFLRQFAGGVRWAHLDIAGTSYVNGDSRLYFEHGGTGSGVRLLTEFLTNH